MNVDEVERKVTGRIGRQAIFAREIGRPLYWTVTYEGVLRHVIGSREVMAGPARPADRGGWLPDIVIQVLPYSANDHPGVDGPMKVFDFAGAPSAAYTECNGGGMIIEQPEQVSQIGD